MPIFEVEVLETSTHVFTVEANSLTEASNNALAIAHATTPDEIEYIIGDVKVLSGGVA